MAGAGGSMRSLLKAGFVAAFAATLVFGHASISAAQQANEATALNNKIAELYSAGRYADAIPIAQRVLAIWEKVLGSDNYTPEAKDYAETQVATALNTLAVLYNLQGRYAD